MHCSRNRFLSLRFPVKLGFIEVLVEHGGVSIAIVSEMISSEVADNSTHMGIVRLLDPGAIVPKAIGVGMHTIGFKGWSLNAIHLEHAMTYSF